MLNAPSLIFGAVLALLFLLLWLASGALGTIISLLALIAMELLLRLGSYQVKIATINELASNSFLVAGRREHFFGRPKKFFDFHPALGVTLAPGENSHTMKIWEMEHSWRFTIDDKGRRITSKKPVGDTKANVGLYGCSITFGWGVNDEKTFPWLLQEAFPHYRFSNYGVPGYSLYQSYLRLQRELPGSRTDAVVLGVIPDHQIRDTVPVEYLLTYNVKKPGIVFDGKRCKEYPPKRYERIAYLKNLAITKSMEHGVNRVRFRGRGDKGVQRCTFQFLLRKVRKLCANHGIPLLVAYLHDEPDWDIFEFLTGNGFSWTRIDYDAMPAREHCHHWNMVFKVRLHPFDPHPNEAAHRFIAKNITGLLPQVLAGTHITPPLADTAVFSGQAEAKEEPGGGVYPLY